MTSGLQVWNGPKIAKYGSKYLGIYDLQLTEEGQQIDSKIFQEISQKLRYNEFRRLLWKGETECYQFIRPITNDEIRNYRNGKDDLTWSTEQILDYARARADRQTSQILNQQQVKNRSSREERWKQWYQKRVQEDDEVTVRKITFLEEKVSKQQLQPETEKLLLDFQVNHVKNLLACLRIKGVTLDASDTGTGKTYSALCVAKELNLMPVVICPKSIIPGWKRAMKHFELDDYYVSNYEQYRVGNTPYLDKMGVNPEYRDFSNTNDHKLKRNDNEKSQKQFRDNLSKIPKIEYRWNLDPNKHLLIFDECHKAKNTSTQNYAIYWWARRTHEATQLKIISLSATVADKIQNAYSICFMLGLVNDGHDFNLTYNLDLDKGVLKDFGFEVTGSGFYKFNQRYQLDKEKYQNEDTNLKKLHHDLFPINGSRMVIEDLGDAFPENFVEAQTYDMDKKADEIQKIYQEMEKNIICLKYQQLEQRQAELTELETATTLSPREVQRLNELRRDQAQDQAKHQALSKKLKAYGSKIQPEHLNKKQFQGEEGNMLTVMLRARQRVELLKTDTLVELASDFYEQGKSVVIFVNFTQTLDYILKQLQSKLKTQKISVIRGGQTTKVRQDQIDAFQENTNRVILATMGTGRESISLHDLKGRHPRVSLISPSWSAQDLVQALGRIHRAEAKSKCLQYLIYCAGTIEDRICEIVQQKLRAISTINDGDLSCGLISSD